MEKFIALLRGINVSGQKIIPMADLRASLEKAGFQAVQTYIQSGNLVFESKGTNTGQLAEEIRQVIMKSFGFDVPVWVHAQSDFRKIPEMNLWFKKGEETKTLYVGFLYQSPEKENIAALKASDTGRDEYLVVAPYVFMKYSEGMGKSKMDNNFFERVLKVKMTTRNWNTIQKLATL